MRHIAGRKMFLVLALGSIAFSVQAAGHGGPVAFDGIPLAPIPFEAQIGVRPEYKQRIEAPPDSPLRTAQLYLGENVFGSNNLALVVRKMKPGHLAANYVAKVVLLDADGTELYSAESPAGRFLPACKGGGAEPSPFAELRALGRNHHWDGKLTTNDFAIYLPYRMEAIRFPADISVSLKDIASGEDLGKVSRRFPSFGRVRLHVARCNPYADEEKVPALLRLWLDGDLLSKAQVRLRLFNDVDSGLIREETLRGFMKRDLKLFLNLAGLAAGKYRVEAELTGIGGVSELSSVWIEKRPLPDPKSLRVPLVIEELPGVSRTKWPATGGVPIPDGILPVSAVNLCAVVDKENKPIPAQFRPLATWAENKRFVRWLLVDIQADSIDGKCGPYALVRSDNPPVASASPLEIEEKPGVLRVSTGPMTVEFNRRAGYFLKQVTLRGRGILDGSRQAEAYMRLLPAGGKGENIFLTTALSTNMDCAVEESGPLRSVVRVSGAYAGPDGKPANECILRFIFTAGRAEFELEHTIVWKLNPADFVIGDYGFRLPVKGLERVTAPDTNMASFVVEAPFSILQTGPAYEHTGQFEYAVNGIRRGERFPGWLAASGTGKRVAIMARDFWQQYPAGIALNGEEIDLQFWPAGGPVLDLRNANETYYRANAVGVAKTHRAVLSFRDGEWDFAGLRDWAGKVEEPLRVAAEPEAVLASGALWRLHPYDPKHFPDDEKALENIFLGLERQLNDTAVFGCMDLGDMHSQWDGVKKQWDPYRYWLCNETTGDATTISTWMQYVRTAQRRYFNFNERRTTHLMDVDMCHFSTNQPPRFDGIYQNDYVNIVGAQHRHTAHHWSGATVLHHTAYDDIALYYHLTGRGRALDVLTEAAESMHDYFPGGEFEGDFRMLSTPFRLVGDLYWQMWNYDHWRMAVELHDRLMTYSFPDNRGEYGYIRYALFSGDRRYALEWAERRIVTGNKLGAAFDPGHADMAARISSYGESCMLAALRYQATNNERVLAPVLKGKFAGGPLAYCVAGPLLANYPNDNPAGNPPGYDWPKMSAFKYAFAMDALVRADVLRKRVLKSPLRTNGRGGGKWTDASAFAGNAHPDVETPVVVETGDKLEYDGLEQGAAAGGLTINLGGSLAVLSGRTLVVRGNIAVHDAEILLGNGSALKIDCNLYSGQYGITFDKGRLEMEGSSPEKRDCFLGPLESDGMHDFFMKFSGNGPERDYLLIRNASLAGCGIDIKGGGVDICNSRLDNVRFEAQHVAHRPFSVKNSDLAGCYFKIYSVMDYVFASNRCERTQTYFHPHDGNAVSRVAGNTFDNCGRALWIVSTGNKAEFMSNSYTNGSVFFVQNSMNTLVLKSEMFKDNDVSVEISDTPGVRMILRDCAFKRARTDVKADIAAGPAKVWLGNCVFDAEPKITVAGEGGVRSDDHNGEAGKTKTWGKPLQEINAAPLVPDPI